MTFDDYDTPDRHRLTNRRLFGAIDQSTKVLASQHLCEAWDGCDGTLAW